MTNLISAMNGAALSSPGVSVSVIDRLSDWEKLEGEWRVLFETSPSASPPLRWEWLYEWWQVYGPVYGDPGGGLRILTVRQGDRLIGALPLYFGRPGAPPLGLKRLGFVASGEEEFEETCSDYLDLLHAPGMERECISALAPALMDSPRLPWDELLLTGISGHSPLLRLESEAGEGRTVETSSLGTCYLSDLTGGFEEYLMRLSSETRKQARKLLRAAEGAGMTFEMAGDEATAMRFFDEMVELHRERWEREGKQGCFAPRHEEFHRRVTRNLLSQGGAVLGRLSWEGKTFAVLHGYRVGTKVDLYHQGVRHETHPVRSPGAAATLMFLRSISEGGCTLLDHLAGANTLKLNYSTDEHPLVEMRMVRPSMRYKLRSASDRTVQTLRKAPRFVRSKLGRAGERD